MSDIPWISVGVFLLGCYIARLWWMDFKSWSRGEEDTGRLPGATAARPLWIVIGILGALVLVLIETLGEYRLGVVTEQTEVTVVALFTFIAAGFYEELIFRGYIFYGDRGKWLLRLSVLGASIGFALLHFNYYMEFPDTGGLSLKIDAKSAWSLGILFINSIWFYYLRFSSNNPHKSLIPCVAAHIVSNIGVFLIKLSQGYVVGWY